MHNLNPSQFRRCFERIIEVGSKQPFAHRFPIHAAVNNGCPRPCCPRTFHRHGGIRRAAHDEDGSSVYFVWFVLVFSLMTGRPLNIHASREQVCFLWILAFTGNSELKYLVS